MATSINRADYAAMFGPTVGDKLRLADTELIIEVERDLTAERTNGGNGMTYGEEVKFGGGKVIRGRHGPIPSHPRRRCCGHRYYQCFDH